MSSQKIITSLVALLLFAALLLPLRAGFTDDGFIHIQYANNIITRGEYSFNAGEVSFGTTSPLWVMVLAALGQILGGGENLIVVSRILSWISGAAAVMLMFTLARGMGLRLWSAQVCTFSFAAHAWHVRWTAMSMETSSAVLAMLAVAIFSIDAHRVAFRAWILGFFMAIASLLRPEAYLLVPVYIVAVLFIGKNRDWRCLWRTLTIFLALVLPWLLFAKLHVGKFLPNTAGAKSGGLVLDPLTFIAKLKPIVMITGSAEGVAALFILIGMLMLRRRARVFSDRYRFLVLWIIALPLAYVLFDIQVLSRYMLLTSPVTVALGFAALEEVVDSLGRLRGGGRKAIAVVGVVMVACNVVLYFAVILSPSKAFSHDLTDRLKSLALYLRDNSHSGAVVAAADIGYLAFYSERHVLDLGGLVEDVTHELREEFTYEEIVDRGLYLKLPKYPRVDFFIDREKSANRFDGKSLAGYRFESIRVDQIDNLGIRKPGPFYYTLYRLHRDSDA